jgi:hypothetical protein
MDAPELAAELAVAFASAAYCHDGDRMREVWAECTPRGRLELACALGELVAEMWRGKCATLS